MLKKLIKYEWNECYKLIGLINLVVLIFSIIACIALSLLDFQGDNARTAFSMIFTMGYGVIYVTVLMAASFGVTLFIYIRFFKNLFSSEGYLMHTLPVKASELIISKLVVAYIIHFITSIVIVVCIGAIVLCIGANLTGDFSFVRQTINEIVSLELPADAIAWFVVYLVGVVITMLISPLFSALTGYFSLSVGQLFNKYKIVWGIGVYFLITFIVQIITTVFVVPISFSMSYSEAGVFISQSVQMMVSSGIMCVCVVVFYLVVNHIVSKKLNLE